MFLESYVFLSLTSKTYAWDNQIMLFALEGGLILLLAARLQTKVLAVLKKTKTSIF